jgi:hypothetical protein
MVLTPFNGISHYSVSLPAFLRHGVNRLSKGKRIEEES